MHRKPKTFPVRRFLAGLAIMASVVAAVLALLVGTAGQASASAPAWQPAMATALARAAERAVITVPDNGVQQTCPLSSIGTHAFIRVAGTGFTFPAVCDPDGPVIAVWDALPQD